MSSTDVEDNVVTAPVAAITPTTPPPLPAPELASGPPAPPAPRWTRLVLGWMACGLTALIVVLYALSPLFQQRDQHRLLVQYRTTLGHSSLESTGLFGATLPTEPPVTGSSVAVLEIGRLRLQDVVVEGAGPAQTEKGPGHVPGTAAPGQPGNAAIVGRSAMFGGAFSGLPSLRKGDPIVVTTTEGQSLYVVSQVRSLTIRSGAPPAADALGTAATGPQAPARLGPEVFADDLYGPSTDSRLTLVTSNSVLPWSTTRATVAVATLRTVPFVATVQQSRSPGQDGRSGAPGSLAPLVLALLLFGGVVVGAVVLYRRCPVRSAYLVTTPPLVVSTILLASAVSRMLPAWT